MKRVGLLIIGLIIGLIAGIAVGYGISASSQPKVATAAPSVPTRAQLLALVNAERAKNGVAPLKEDPRLDASAQMKADDEVANNYFGHMRNGVFVGQQDMAATGITCVLDAENLQRENYGPNTAKADVDSWISSPEHHAAMINPKYTLTGFGIDGNEIAEHFCKP